MSVTIAPATHHALYHDWRAALAFCRAIPDAPPAAPTTFHMYWRQQRAGLFRRARPFGRKQALPVKAFFATQDLSRCSLTMWSDGDLSDSEWLRPFVDRIAFREYRPELEVRGTAIEAHPETFRQQDRRVWRDGDLFRILILHRYGGVYVDMDMVLLRSLGPLLDTEFIYQWEDYDGVYNGALMYLCAGSRFGRELIDGVLEIPPANFAWGRDNLVRAVSRGCPITIYPAAFFDAEWQAEQKFVGFKATPSGADLYDGAFAWHWHNQWDAAIEPGSRFERYETLIDRRLVELGILDAAAAGAGRR